MVAANDYDELDLAETIADAITILVRRAGSDDKFAAQLGTSRQTVIRWRKHGVFPEDYVDRLRELGVPERLLERFSRAEVESRLRKAEAEIAEIRRLLR